MSTMTMKPRFIWSVFLLCGLLTVALISKEGDHPSPIHGESDYTITLDSTNTPPTESYYSDTNQVVRYTTFNYGDVKASSGNHIELSPNGWMRNALDSPITSITGITATFATEGSLGITISYDQINYFDYVLASGTRLDFANLPYYFELYSDGSHLVTIENLVITYSCVAHAESLDTYEVYWYDETGDVLYEKDTGVVSGTVASYDSYVVPSKTYDYASGMVYAFAGWDGAVGEVYGNTYYHATFVEVEATFDLLGGTDYQLTSITDTTMTALGVPSTYNGLPITSIGSECFRDLTHLSKLSLPDTLIAIGDGAFAGCTSLTSIRIPKTVEYIGMNVTIGCASLTSIDVDPLNAYYSSIDGVLFAETETVLVAHPSNHGSDYVIPSTVTTIASFAFAESAALTSVTFPSGLISIGDNAFVNCTSLDNVVLPDSVTTLGIGSFALCSSLTTITLPSGLTTIPESLFNRCSSLATLTLPDTVTIIGSYAFYQCTGLTSIHYPANLASIGNYSFRYCTLLENPSFPNTLIQIGNGAFSWCNTMTSVHIPASVTSIATYAFTDCSSLTEFSVDAENSTFSAIDGVLFSKDVTALYCYPMGKTATYYVVPSSVERITEGAFRSNVYLTSVVIPTSVVNAYYASFYACTNLTINCVAASQPSGWSTDWNLSAHPVVWGYVAE